MRPIHLESVPFWSPWRTQFDSVFWTHCLLLREANLEETQPISCLTLPSWRDLEHVCVCVGVGVFLGTSKKTTGGFFSSLRVCRVGSVTSTQVPGLPRQICSKKGCGQLGLGLEPDCFLTSTMAKENRLSTSKLSVIRFKSGAMTLVAGSLGYTSTLLLRFNSKGRGEWDGMGISFECQGLVVTQVS